MSYEMAIAGLLCILLYCVVQIVVLCKFIWQHNEVNATYNEINSFVAWENSNAGSSISNGETVLRESSEMHYFINLDNKVYGPFTLLELKNDYPIMKDTLITTDTLNSEWYEAQYFECFDELFDAKQDFRINECGEIVRF